MSIEGSELPGAEGLEEVEPQPPVAHIHITYTGPVAPHWDFSYEFGDESLVEEFRHRAMARLQLLPPHDPQFRRNRERVNRDAERENVVLDWDLGYDDEDVEDAASLGDKPTPTYAEAASEGTEAASEGTEEPAGEGTEEPASEGAGDATDTPAEAASDEATTES